MKPEVRADDRDTAGNTARTPTWIRVLIFALIALVLVALPSVLSTCDAGARMPASLSLKVEGMGVSKTLSVPDLNSIDQAKGLYTAVNNWPSHKQYAAGGISVESLLSSLQVSPKTITFVSRDGYSAALTYQQLTEPRYSFASAGAPVRVKPILAYRYAADATALSDMKPQSSLTLVFGQLTASEATNPAFVENVVKIVLSDKEETWESPGMFPPSGVVAPGDVVKLTHPSAGLVKIYYTLDGATPTLDSKLYNPSTYQPELNKPIPVSADTTIKAIALGFGKQPSAVATFQVKVR
ncbi:MAG: chitobiase/beta-hexosaminidase C-terminal domain-containing protein [Coriobacteriia bacterium]|nr:chitobiase/beta-hexosaminidase C-terminal domain-containing protein [Coriobacteriia bacterium]